MKVELRKVIRNILGDITVHCETYHDKEVLSNIDNYKEACDEILDSLGACSYYADDYRYSGQLCGIKAKEYLKEIYNRIGYFIQEEEDIEDE